MEPAIDTGAIVLMKHQEGPPRVGDVVAVPVPAEAQQDGYPEKVIHRVIEVTEDGLVRTQGDNLDKPDPFAVPVSAVTERVITVIPGAGNLIAFTFSPYGLLWMAAGVLIFVIMPFSDSQRGLKQAISEYGYHLRSHTEILQSMSVASQELARTAVQLRETLAAGSGGSAQPAKRVRTDRERDAEHDANLPEGLHPLTDPGGDSTKLPEPQPETDHEVTGAASSTTTAGEEAPRLSSWRTSPKAGGAGLAASDNCGEPLDDIDGRLTGLYSGPFDFHPRTLGQFGPYKSNSRWRRRVRMARRGRQAPSTR
jgi:hypothetical protein